MVYFIHTSTSIFSHSLNNWDINFSAGKPAFPTDPDIMKASNVSGSVVGDEIEYILTVRNPNDFVLEDFVVVDNLAFDFVEFVPESIKLNGYT